MSSIEKFESELFAANIIDPDGVHSVFTSGLHGQKINFKQIPDGSELFDLWVTTTARYIDENYPETEVPELFVASVDSGTNRLVGPVAEELGCRASAHLTKKVRDGEIVLVPDAVDAIRVYSPDLVLFLDDAGTTGCTVSTGVIHARAVGARRTAVLYAIQRSGTLPSLDDIDADYGAMIKREMPAYTAEECAQDYFCAAGWDLRKRQGGA